MIHLIHQKTKLIEIIFPQGVKIQPNCISFILLCGYIFAFPSRFISQVYKRMLFFNTLAPFSEHSVMRPFCMACMSSWSWMCLWICASQRGVREVWAARPSMNNPSERRGWMGEQEMTELNKRGLSARTMKAGEREWEVGGRKGGRWTWKHTQRRKKTGCTPAYRFTPEINKVDTQWSMWSEHPRGHDTISAKQIATGVSNVTEETATGELPIMKSWGDTRKAAKSGPSVVKWRGGRASDLLHIFCDCSHRSPDASEKNTTKPWCQEVKAFSLTVCGNFFSSIFWLSQS